MLGHFININEKIPYFFLIYGKFAYRKELKYSCFFLIHFLIHIDKSSIYKEFKYIPVFFLITQFMKNFMFRGI